MGGVWRSLGARISSVSYGYDLTTQWVAPKPPCKHNKGSVTEQVKDTRTLYYPIPPDSRQEFLLFISRHKALKGRRKCPSTLPALWSC